MAGGAAFGAYQAGALKAVYEQQIQFHAIAACSVGVIHALAWNHGDLMRTIDQHWRENISRLEPFNAKNLLRLKNPFQFRDSLDELFDHYRDSHPDAEEDGQIPIIVSLTEAEAGRNTAFNLADPDLTQQERELICKASTIIPPLGDKPIEIRGRRYYDGGFSNNVPVDLLTDMALDEIWVIRMLPPRQPAAWQEKAWQTSQDIRAKAKHPWLLGATGMAAQILDPQDPAMAEEVTVVIRPAARGPFRRFRLHRALNFSRRNIKTLLKMGYQDGQQACRSYLDSVDLN